MTTTEHAQQADYYGVSGKFAVCSCGALAVYGEDRYYTTSREAFAEHQAAAVVEALEVPRG